MTAALNIRTLGDVVVIEPGTQIRMCADELPALVTGYLDRRTANFILNLHGVEHMDSSTLGGIALSHGFASRRGGRFTLCCCVPRLVRLFHTTKLSSIFEVFDTEDEALKSFDPDAPTRPA
ncbi:MAG TPA: STAS domain-containing protein [Vicinamibacterales bacterium]|nr:STAS domain-containing protein [Vicinamibacterales bacterium]